jgi:hypothetical protein
MRRFVVVALAIGLLPGACSLYLLLTMATRAGPAKPTHAITAARITSTPVPHGYPAPQPDAAPGYAGAWLDLSKASAVTIHCDGFTFGHTDPSYRTTWLHNALLHSSRSTADPHQQARLVATVTVAHMGTGRWNSPDGSPPTQAYLNSLRHPVKVDGRWPVEPSVYTPWTLPVIHVIRGDVQAVEGPPQITAYIEGGTAKGPMGSFSVRNTCLPPLPSVGATYLVWFGGELTTGVMGDAPIDQPMLTDWLPYDPTTDSVTTASGPVNLQAILRGLPSGSRTAL